MNASLQGKVCLVTGASRGIGAAIAGGLADRGARVIVHYGRNRDNAEQVAASLAGEGHIVAGSDLANLESLHEFLAGVAAEAGRLDVLVNNAGVYTKHNPLHSDAAQWLDCWKDVIAVNLIAPAMLCHAAASIMQQEGGGRIINIGSRGAFRGEPDGPAYAASKAGLHALSQSLALALAPQGILVYALAPGFVATDMASALLDGIEGEGIRAQSPLNRVARPDEVAEVACYLATSNAEFLTGGIIDLNGASYLRN